jgi:hypothetical protein
MQQETGKEITPPPRRSRSAVLAPPPTDERPSLSVKRAIKTIKRHQERRRAPERSWPSIHIDPSGQSWVDEVSTLLGLELSRLS